MGQPSTRQTDSASRAAPHCRMSPVHSAVEESGVVASEPRASGRSRPGSPRCGGSFTFPLSAARQPHHSAQLTVSTWAAPREACDNYVFTACCSLRARPHFSPTDERRQGFHIAHRLRRSRHDVSADYREIRGGSPGAQLTARHVEALRLQVAHVLCERGSEVWPVHVRSGPRAVGEGP